MDMNKDRTSRRSILSRLLKFCCCIGNDEDQEECDGDDDIIVTRVFAASDDNKMEGHQDLTAGFPYVAVDDINKDEETKTNSVAHEAVVNEEIVDSEDLKIEITL
jgi:hypothetical protein